MQRPVPDLLPEVGLPERLAAAYQEEADERASRAKLDDDQRHRDAVFWRALREEAFRLDRIARPGPAGVAPFDDDRLFTAVVSMLRKRAAPAGHARAEAVLPERIAADLQGEER